MKHFFALLLSALMVLSLLTACGDKTTPSDGDDQTVTDENGSDTDNNTDDTTDPYDAVRNYWSEDQLTQAWGPDQVVEHLFFHPIIAYPQWAFHDCNASQDQRYGLDDWMVTVGRIQQNFAVRVRQGLHLSRDGRRLERGDGRVRHAYGAKHPDAARGQKAARHQL